MPIIPLVFYHGKQLWRGARFFQENFEKSVFSEEFKGLFKGNVLNFQKGLSEENQKTLLISGTNYLKKNVRGLRWEWLVEAEEEALKTGILRKGGIMGLLEYTKMEERQKGRQEGRQEGQREVILKMLQKETDISLHMHLT